MEIDDKKIHEEEIAYRKSIFLKSKITSEDRLWLITHSLYNRKLGFPYFNWAIEKVTPKKWYILKVCIESISYDKRIIPIISVPAGKGKIVADFKVTDLKGRMSTGKPIKMLGLELDMAMQTSEVQYQSDLGLLSVEYECDYYCNRQNLNMRKSSSTGDFNFAMIKQIINDHKMRYFCKSPVKDSFDAMVFTIEWSERE